MKNYKSYIILFFLIVVSAVSFSQKNQTKTSPLDVDPIVDQLEFVIKKSTKYSVQDRVFRAILNTRIEKLRKNILDSLQHNHKNMNNLRITISQQEQEITNLKSDLIKLTTSLDYAIEQKDSLYFFDSLISKNAYQWIMWSIIVGLLVLLALFVYKFKDSSTLTKEVKKSLAELNIEFEAHRRRALEREQKVRRQLQDEINKQKISKQKDK